MLQSKTEAEEFEQHPKRNFYYFKIHISYTYNIGILITEHNIN